jgi:signal transduction histidine kinase/CheY-like chemotaxis protein
VVGAAFSVRSWLGEFPAEAILELTTAAWLVGIVVALRRGLAAGWAERAGAAGLVAMTVGVCLCRGEFLPTLLVWNAIIPLGLVVSGRRVRQELWVWAGITVAATAGTYVATEGLPGAAELRGLDPVLSLMVFFPALFGVAWMYLEDQQRLRTANLQLERQRRVGAKMQSVGRLAGGIAHDFNNLLTIINTHAELLGERAAAEEWAREARDGLDSIASATDRGQHLTRQLLAFGGRGVRAPVALFPADTLRHTLRLLNRTLPENLELSTRIEADGWAVSADPTDIENAIINLVANARDAMPKGGEVKVRCFNAIVDRCRRPGDPDVPPGRYVGIEVGDSGTGMSVQLMDQIFDPFFTTKSGTSGSGLGLTSAYTAMRKLGGDLTVSSELGHGSRFTIYLPVSDESADVLRRAGSTPVPTQPATVLLVEDEPGVRMAAGLLLRARGYDLIVAENGTEAIAMFEKHRAKIQVVLTDLVMPGPSGLEVARTIRELAPRVGIVFMSGYADEPAVERFVAEHGARFVRKPFSADDLTAAIGQVLAAGRISGVA